MKNYILYFLLIGWCITGCTENDMNPFEGEAGLHFKLTDKQLDSIEISFTSIMEDYYVLDLPIELEGYAADRDRKFGLKIIADETTAVPGKHYEPLAQEYTLKKEEYAAIVPVKWLYTEEMDTVAVRLKLQIDISDSFIPGEPDKQTVLLVCSNILPSIPVWKNYYQSFFGDYSKVKHRYILNILHLKEIPLEYKKENRSKWIAYGMEMNNFFTDNVILDENKNRIEPWIY